MSQRVDLQQKKFIKKHPNGCPNENRLCNHITMELCDPCIDELMTTEVIPVEVAVSGRSACEAHDVQPTQEFKVSSSGLICQDCQKPEGSNPTCLICAFFHESAETARNGDLNPKVPTTVVFQRDVGPRHGDLRALTPEAVQESVDFLKHVFASMVLPQIPVASSIPDSHVGPWIGCEWSSGNCWLVVILEMFLTGSWHTSINVSNPLGNALWILIRELRMIGFVPRQKLQAFRILTAEIIGQREKGTLFENGQMDPFEVLRMLENAGAFIYHYRISWAGYVEGAHATPVIDLGMLSSKSGNLIEKLNELDPEINFSQEYKFLNLPTKLLIRVCDPDKVLGTKIDFPTTATFDVGPLAFEVNSVVIFERGHYETVFIKLKYCPITDSFSITYWLSDSKSDVMDCGHHVPSIVEIDQSRFSQLWKDHAIAITCTRIPNKRGMIDEIPHEWSGTEFEPLKPGGDSLPECNKGEYTTFGPNGEIHIKQCMTLSDFREVLSQSQRAPCASGPWVPPPQQQVPSVQVAPALPPPQQASCAKAGPDNEPLNSNFVYMVYSSCKWFLYTRMRNGKLIAEGGIIKDGKNPLYTFGKSTFSSKGELEIALQAVYGKESRQDFS